MDLNERKSLIEAFITSQFSYCHLIWLFHSPNLNTINRIHERVYQNNWSFSKLLDLDISLLVNHKILQSLEIKIYKGENGITPEIMKDIVKFQNPS